MQGAFYKLQDEPVYSHHYITFLTIVNMVPLKNQEDNMKKSKEHLKIEKEIGRVINEISPEKLDRALYILDYMVKSSIEVGRMLVEYSKREDATIDMIVDWVKNKQKEEKGNEKSRATA